MDERINLEDALFGDPKRWRGGYQSFTDPNARLLMWDIPDSWLSATPEYRKTKRKDILKDTLAWAMASVLIEGIPDLTDDFLDQMIIPVRLAERAKRIAFRADKERVVAWASSLSEHTMQVKLFAKSLQPDRFDVKDFTFRRPDPASFTAVSLEPGEWMYGLISEWRKSLPEVILDAIER
jgi:hypothetical protein